MKADEAMTQVLSAMLTRRRGNSWIVLLSAAILVMPANPGASAQELTIGLEAYSQAKWSASRKSFGSPVHHVPCTGDTIAFYGKGAYHLFILKDGGWQHIRSKDLLNWEEFPMALTKGKPEDADGEYCFTGHIMEHDGTYHIFYPGVNRKHPRGSMQMMHATSQDLINFTKHPEETWGPDGIHYKTRTQTPERAGSVEQPTFKDQCVVWNEKEQKWWMFFSAQSVSGKFDATPLAVSDDLIKWKQVEPIKGLPVGDCTDIFKIGEWWYRISYDTYWRAKDLAGPWGENDSGAGYKFDTPYFFVPKRCWDGKRHVLIGGMRNYYGEVDHSNPVAPHCVAIPREVYADAEGFLCTRPVLEVTAIYNKAILDLAKKPKPDISPLLRSWLPKGEITPSWKYVGTELVNADAHLNEYSHCSFDVPRDYMLKMQVHVEHKAAFTIGFREQQGDKRSGYKLVINRRTNEVEINSPSDAYPRPVNLKADRPITVQAFMIGSILECWVNDAHAFSLRDYDFPEGKLSFDVVNGRAWIQSMTVITARKKR
jgi:beta-fructofuranosidase